VAAGVLVLVHVVVGVRVAVGGPVLVGVLVGVLVLVGVRVHGASSRPIGRPRRAAWNGFFGEV
jgi:hypothetical protein